MFVPHEFARQLLHDVSRHKIPRKKKSAPDTLWPGSDTKQKKREHLAQSKLALIPNLKKREHLAQKDIKLLILRWASWRWKRVVKSRIRAGVGKGAQNFLSLTSFSGSYERKKKKLVFRFEREATLLCALSSDHDKISRLVKKNSKNSQAFFCPNRGTLCYLLSLVLLGHFLTQKIILFLL